MYSGKTVFAQLMDCLPWSTFSRLVARYCGDHDVRTFPCVEQYRGLSVGSIGEALSHGFSPGRHWLMRMKPMIGGFTLNSRND